MTASKELHDQIDRLSPQKLQELQAFLEGQERLQQVEADELERLLGVLAEPLPAEEQQALLADLERRPLRSPSLKDAS